MRSPSILAAALALTATLSPPGPLAAATLHADGAGCTLADAIRSANADIVPAGSSCVQGSGPDVIVLDADEEITAAEATAAASSNLEGGIAGLPDVTTTITIQAGAADRIARDLSLLCPTQSPNAFRLFNVVFGTLTLEGITLRNGCIAPAAPLAGRGGAVLVQSGNLTVVGGELSGNRVRGGDGIGMVGGSVFGGAVAALGVGAVTVDGTRLAANFARAGDSDVQGGSVYGGAIEVEIADLTIVGGDLSGNTARGGDCGACFGGFADGGAVRASSATVDLRDSVLTGNEARGGDSDSSAGDGRGGAIAASTSTGTLRRLILRDNLAVGGDSSGSLGGGGSGGGIWVAGGTSPSLFDSLLEANTARGGTPGGEGWGGGAYFGAPGGEIAGCTFSGNLAEGTDGAPPAIVFGGGLVATGSGLLTGPANSTFSGNVARAGAHTGAGTGGSAQGGAIYTGRALDGFSHTTIAGNEAIGGAGTVGGSARGGGLYVSVLTVDVDDSLLADNRVTPGGGVTADQDCYNSAGVLVSDGYNLVEAPHSTCTFAAAGDQTGIDPLLHPLGDHGCATPLPDGTCLPTIALPAASPAVDAGSCAVSGLAADERGVTRPIDVATATDADDGCDVGGFELLAGAFHTLAPCRLVDTRLPADSPALTSNVARTFTLAGHCGIPESAVAVSLNATVTEPTNSGFLTVYPGSSPLPGTSTQNFSAGQTRANNLVVSLAADGSGTVTANAVVVGPGTVHFILDVTGWFE